jgi:hypothetical protein
MPSYCPLQCCMAIASGQPAHQGRFPKCCWPFHGTATFLGLALAPPQDNHPSSSSLAAIRLFENPIVALMTFIFTLQSSPDPSRLALNQFQRGRIAQSSAAHYRSVRSACAFRAVVDFSPLSARNLEMARGCT